MLSGLRKRSLSLPLPLRMRHQGFGAEFNAPGPAIRAWDLGKDVPPEPPCQAGRLGLGLDTWQDSPLRRNKALPSMIPHRSTQLGTLAQRRGIRGRDGRTNTHTRTAPAARLRAKAHSADALAAANTRTVSLGVWRDA